MTENISQDERVFAICSRLVSLNQNYLEERGELLRELRIALAPAVPQVKKTVARKPRPSRAKVKSPPAAKTPGSKRKPRPSRAKAKLRQSSLIQDFGPDPTPSPPDAAGVSDIDAETSIEELERRGYVHPPGNGFSDDAVPVRVPRPNRKGLARMGRR